MMKYLAAALAFVSCLQADITPISRMETIQESISDRCFVFFNIAEVLLDTETSLGSQRWRKWVRARVAPSLHDALTLFVFQKVPPIVPERDTVDLIRNLQARGVRVFAVTARGRDEWYSTRVPHVDQITEAILQQVGFHFATEDIIYGGNISDLLGEMEHKPDCVVYVDDKLDSLKKVEKQLQTLGIPFKGYEYMRTAEEHAHFDPIIAHIQLDRLLTSGQVYSDAEAAVVKAAHGFDSDCYWHSVIHKFVRGRVVQ